MHNQEKCTFTWHNYSEHLRKVLREMMVTSEFADVTLVTDDKQQIRAHRNILSASSPVFKNFLQSKSGNTDSVIDLRGIQHSEMESIMEFIYLGEARISEERITEFLIVLKDLEINKKLLTPIEPNEYEDATLTHENDTNVEPQTHTIAINNMVTRADCLKYSCNSVSKNLEIKELLTGIEMNDQNTSDNVEINENNVSDENMDIAGAPPHTTHEDGGNVEPQAKTEPITPNNAANRRVRRSEVVFGDVKFQCQDCEIVFNLIVNKV